MKLYKMGLIIEDFLWGCYFLVCWVKVMNKDRFMVYKVCKFISFIIEFMNIEFLKILL